MARKVNADPGTRQRQIERTERHIVDAATRLFLDRGYTATTLADVAEEAGVGARTVYVRFGSKAGLFKRVVDVAVAGDTEPLDVMARPDAQTALSAPGLGERIAAMAAGARAIMERTGGLFAVARQAAAVEPLIEEYWQQGREGTRQAHNAVWRKAERDGLLHPDADVEHIVDTASVLGAAETYLLITRMLGWSLEIYEAWLREMFTSLAWPPDGPGATSAPR